jgi:hypothetical protein
MARAGAAMAHRPFGERRRYGVRVRKCSERDMRM